MRQPAEILWSSEDVQRLTVLLQTVELPEKTRRQLRILDALRSGMPGAYVAMQEKVSAQLVSKIRKDAADLTPKHFMDRLTKRCQRTKKEVPLKLPHAGRPGYDNFDQWLGALKIEDEPIFELSTLVLQSEVQIASLSIREGKLWDFDRAKVVDQRQAARWAKGLKEEWNTPVYWTRVSMLDTMLAEIFQRLHQLPATLKQARSSTTKCEPLKSLRERFDARFFHIIFSSGSEEACNDVVAKLSQDVRCEHVRVDADFVKRLEAMLHFCRLTRNSAGFLPTVSVLLKQLRNLRAELEAPSLHWMSRAHDVEGYLKHNVLAYDYFAAGGILIGLGSKLASRVAYQDEVQFRTLEMSPKVSIESEIAPEIFKVLVSPLPDMEYKMWVPWKGSRGELEKRIRRRFRESHESKKFVYSTRKQALGGARPSMAIPSDFLRNDNANKMRIETGIVLFFRHFLTPEPDMPLDRFSDLAKRQCGASGFSKTRWGNRTLHCLHAPYLVEALREKAGTMFYWKQLKALEHRQDILLKLKEVSPQQETFFAAFTKLRPVAVLEKDAWDHFMTGNGAVTMEQIEAVANQTAANTGKIDWSAVLAEKTVPRLLHEASFDLEAMTKILELSGQPSFSEALGIQIDVIEQILSGESAGNRQPPPLVENSCAAADVQNQIEDVIRRQQMKRTAKKHLPAYSDDSGAVALARNKINDEIIKDAMDLRENPNPDPEADFINILQELDADFLLRGLDKDTRERLDEDAAIWADACAGVIYEKFWNKETKDIRPGSTRTQQDLAEIGVNLFAIKSLVGPRMSPLFERYEAEVCSICNGLLTRFYDRRFGIRMLMENMQRCALRSLDPIPLAYTTSESILARWKTLVATTLKKRLLTLEKRSQNTLSLDNDSIRHEETLPSQDELSQPESVEGNALEGKGYRHKESDDILDILEAIFSRNASEADLKKFIQLAKKNRSASWAPALQQIQESIPRALERITEALKYCVQTETGKISLPKVRQILLGSTPPK